MCVHNTMENMKVRHSICHEAKHDLLDEATHPRAMPKEVVQKMIRK